MNNPAKEPKDICPKVTSPGSPDHGVESRPAKCPSDPQPDGVFDYVEGFTVVSSQARIIFPLLEPFGNDLDSLAFKNSQSLAKNYIFTQLYDTIKEVAKTYAQVDRYYLSGVAKGTASSDISLGAFNVPQGSVIVTAGGQTLRENIDYTVDYSNWVGKSDQPVHHQFRCACECAI